MLAPNPESAPINDCSLNVTDGNAANVEGSTFQAKMNALIT